MMHRMSRRMFHGDRDGSGTPTGFELSGSVRIFGHNETLMKRTNCFNFSHCLIRSSKTTDLIYRHGRDSVLFAVEAYYRANMPV